MRITMVVPSLGVGGCEHYVAVVAAYLDQRAEVVVVHQSCIAKAMGGLLGSTARQSMQVLRDTPRPRALLRNVLRPLRPDHVIVVLPLPTAEPGGPDPLDILEVASELAPLTVVFQLAHDPAPLPSAERKRAQQLLAQTDQRWVAVSAQNGSALASSFHVPASAITIVPNGVQSRSPASIQPADRPTGPRPVLLQVGRLARWKAQGDSIRALSYMEHAADLWLVGQGYDRDRLESLVREYNLGDRVKFMGQRNDVERLMQRADVILHPTLAEGASFALLEAMAGGRPIVASGAASNPELVRHGRDGWIHPPECPELQAALIDDALQRHHEAERRARSAQIRVSTAYTREKMLLGIQSVIERSL